MTRAALLRLLGLALLGALCAALVPGESPARPESPVVLKGWGTAVIDGRIDPREWANAVRGHTTVRYPCRAASQR